LLTALRVQGFTYGEQEIMRLANKTALISGGASGIGRAIAEVFLEAGASVVISDINAPMLEEAVRELSAFGRVSGVSGDVRSMADARKMVERTVELYGAIDILVCNAGITSVMPIEQLEEDEWDAVLSTNIKGMFTLIKCAVPLMKAQGGGKIVTLGSEMGIVAVPESPAYCASKGAVIMFTKSIAIDLIRHNIRVNSLCPGITRTPLLQAEVDNSLDPEKTAAEQASWAPIMRVADPREIAQGALFLASDESSFAVGSCLVLDGGFTAK
jgi:NAD(P)-dependent dehydrogenase (short-subunit alcohol dehydrogenase family)